MSPNLPVLFITAAANEREAVEALGAGLDNYVLKTAGFDLRLQVAVQTAIAAPRPSKRVSRTERRLGNLLTRLNVGVFRSTASGKIIEANPAFLALLGFATLEEAQSWGIDKLYARPGERAQLLQRMKEHGTVKEAEVQFRRMDGQVLWVQLTKTLAPRSTGRWSSTASSRTSPSAAARRTRCGRARSASPWRPPGRPTGCGTGTWRRARSSTRGASRPCSGSSRARWTPTLRAGSRS